MAKVKVVTDVTMELDPPSFYWRTLADKERLLESWAEDLEDFIRDHRSQDPVSITVKRVYEEQCSFCHRSWETFDDGEPACCEAAQNEWAAQRPATPEEVAV